MVGKTPKDGPHILKDFASVSRETEERLKTYVDLVLRWQPAQNLISPATIPEIWRRHVADSLQPHLVRPEAKRWVDLGSGAGFPGIVTAILLADTPGAHVYFVESNQRKAAFLRTALRETGSSGTVLPVRIESAAEQWTHGPVDAVSARALASLDALLHYCRRFMEEGAVAVFHKGRDFQREVNEASHAWGFDLVEKVSLIDPESRMLILSNLAARSVEEGSR
ncbi:16S rRNA (guanine(527)-N(7))-methyltransferase RsmG [Microvirga tunisiensis]|uniref:16S rRNA (Guanine(527)-N(7))-methyltransferase RsmG n=2 Tax=Pannonibacter tanglangensis TaxID=2750084 RepID=A0ABW9ZKZ3_9HYPH|nr:MULTISPECIES: 16S rRNA (guanine(527)-N(7))-methyltransferase RsmG [unclassified Pannonibacter]NBN65588.1 16S rRNA (guanine(527)-N(7))-methyltransferase RsmG [Pannonibacter sp. XCT-34]NBN80185.1 16S rRNA (guanine(527)-N(7))-methyltransferase RsmG [Pannonibacter sp. XCT-53]